VDSSNNNKKITSYISRYLNVFSSSILPFSKMSSILQSKKRFSFEAGFLLNRKNTREEIIGEEKFYRTIYADWLQFAKTKFPKARKKLFIRRNKFRNIK